MNTQERDLEFTLSSPPGSAFRPLTSRPPARNLDVLRTLAVLLVVMSHLLGNGLKLYDAGYTFPHGLGRLGVMIFFVHTSLVLMMSMDRMPESGARLVKAFYIRRAFRIYPLSIIAVLAVAFLRLPSDTLDAHRGVSAFDLLSNLALVQNLTRAQNVIGPLWSLPWEVQMYMVLPCIYLLLRKGRIGLLTLILGVVVLTNVLGLMRGHAVVRIFDYVPCFCFGVLAFVLLKVFPQKLPGKMWLPALLVIAVAYIGLAFTWPLGRVFFREWGVCLVLGLAIPLFKEMSASHLAAAAHLIAKYSYGIYLFHVPALLIVFGVSKIAPVVSVPAFFALTFVIAWAGYRVVEEPMIRYGKRMAMC